MVFTIKYGIIWVFPVNFPLNQSIDSDFTDPGSFTRISKRPVMTHPVASENS